MCSINVAQVDCSSEPENSLVLCLTWYVLNTDECGIA